MWRTGPWLLIGDAPRGVHHRAGRRLGLKTEAEVDGILGRSIRTHIVPPAPPGLLEAEAGIERARRHVALGNLQIEPPRAAPDGGATQFLDQPAADAEPLPLPGHAQGEHLRLVRRHPSEDVAPRRRQHLRADDTGAGGEGERTGMGEQLPEARRIPALVQQAGLQPRQLARVLHSAAADAHGPECDGLGHGGVRANGATCARASGGRR
jgi:hypothetical protein